MAYEMKPRERVLAALRHEESDRVPVDLGSCGPTAIHINAYRSLLSYLSRNWDISLWDVVGQLAQPSEQILEMLGADVRGIRVGSLSSLHSAASPQCVIDPWGTTWALRPSATCYSIISYPLAGASSLEGYVFPEGKYLAGGAGLRQRALQLREEGRYAILGEVSGLLLERAQMIRGFDSFLLDLIENPTFAEDLLDHILQVETDIACTFLDGVGDTLDIFAFKDDLGMQSESAHFADDVPASPEAANAKVPGFSPKTHPCKDLVPQLRVRLLRDPRSYRLGNRHSQPGPS